MCRRRVRPGTGGPELSPAEHRRSEPITQQTPRQAEGGHPSRFWQEDCQRTAGPQLSTTGKVGGLAFEGEIFELALQLPYLLGIATPILPSGLLDGCGGFGEQVAGPLSLAALFLSDRLRLPQQPVVFSDCGPTRTGCPGGSSLGPFDLLGSIRVASQESRNNRGVVSRNRDADWSPIAK